VAISLGFSRISSYFSCCWQTVDNNANAPPTTTAAATTRTSSSSNNKKLPKSNGQQQQQQHHQQQQQQNSNNNNKHIRRGCAKRGLQRNKKLAREQELLGHVNCGAISISVCVSIRFAIREILFASRDRQTVIFGAEQE